MSLDKTSAEIFKYFEEKNFEVSRIFSYKYSTEPVKQALEGLSRPQDLYKTVHIAGTVAKGSTVKLISEMLVKEGFKVGSFYSPHLLRLNERMQINHREIPDQHLSRLWKFVQRELDLARLSFFDCITVIAFLHFKEEKVDWAVIETGLGGRKDSTNNLRPEFSIITPIGFDHKHILGNRLSAIASEKAGIIKSQPVFSYPQAKEVKAVLKEEAVKKKSPLLFYPAKNGYEQKMYPEKNQSVCQWVYSEYFKKPHPKTSTHFQGRLETLSQDPYIVFDSAHNEMGAKELAFWLSRQAIRQKWCLYFNVLNNRPGREILRTLLQAKDRIEKIYFLDIPIPGRQFYEYEKLIPLPEAFPEIIPITKNEELLHSLKNRRYGHLICGSMYFYELFSTVHKSVFTG